MGAASSKMRMTAGMPTSDPKVLIGRLRSEMMKSSGPIIIVTQSLRPDLSLSWKYQEDPVSQEWLLTSGRLVVDILDTLAQVPSRLPRDTNWLRTMTPGTRMPQTSSPIQSLLRATTATGITRGKALGMCHWLRSTSTTTGRTRETPKEPRERDPPRELRHQQEDLETHQGWKGEGTSQQGPLTGRGARRTVEAGRRSGQGGGTQGDPEAKGDTPGGKRGRGRVRFQ